MGFTLVELMLVTVIIGLIASISAPFVQTARDRAFVTAAKSDLRNIQTAIETYIALENKWPLSIADLTEKGYFTSTEDVAVCHFLPIPPFTWRPASVLLMLAHEGSATMVYTLYPIYNGKIIEFSSSTQGCTL